MCRVDIYKSVEILSVVHLDTCWFVHLRVLLPETILPNKEAHLKSVFLPKSEISCNGMIQ